jgi:hypothetical protein
VLQRLTHATLVATAVQAISVAFLVANHVLRPLGLVILAPVALSALPVAALIGAMASARLLARSRHVQPHGRYVACAIVGLAISSPTLAAFGWVLLMVMIS